MQTGWNSIFFYYGYSTLPAAFGRENVSLSKRETVNALDVQSVSSFRSLPNSFFAARYPRSCFGISMVVRRGLVTAEAQILSNPTTEMSYGTRMPFLVRLSRTPMARMSLAQKMMVGRSFELIIREAIMEPNSPVKGPINTCTWFS